MCAHTGCQLWRASNHKLTPPDAAAPLPDRRPVAHRQGAGTAGKGLPKVEEAQVLGHIQLDAAAAHQLQGSKGTGKVLDGGFSRAAVQSCME